MCRRARCSRELAERAPPPAPPSVSPPPLWLAQRIEAPALEELIDERAPAVGAEEGTRGVATLKAQSQCPFRGFAETRLDAYALEQPAPGFNERERGQILHETLQGIFTEVRDSRRSRGSHRTARGECDAGSPGMCAAR